MQRIVSLLSAATEMLFALGLSEQVVGVSHECDYPPQIAGLPRLTFSQVDSAAGSAAIDRQVRQRVAAGEPLYGVDEALLTQLRPTLVVTQAQCDVCAVRYVDVMETVARIDPAGAIRVIALNPSSLGEILADIARVGAAAGVPAAAKRYVASLRQRIAAVCAATQGIAQDDRPRVAVVEWVEPLMVAANWTPELIGLCGGVCALAKAGEHSAYTSWDALRAYDPQVLLVAACGFDLPRTIIEAARLPRLPGWSELSAVRSGRAWAVDGNAYFNRPGPRIVDTLELLAHLVHPRHVGPPACIGGSGRKRVETSENHA